MPDVNIKRVPSAADRTLHAFEKADRLINDIRERAYSLFESRGFGEGSALADWLTAEREAGWLHANVVEGEKAFTVEVTIPGFDAGEIEVTVSPRELVVHGRRDVDTTDEKAGRTVHRHKEVCRHVELPADVDVKKVTSTLKNGILTVVAPKAGAGVARIRVASPK
jgi:HSP20 family molecular chaperone IbpA